MSKIKMRVNHDTESVCVLCQEQYKSTLEMYDLLLDKTMFTICKDCSEELFMKLLKAECMYNGKVKSKEDLARVARHVAKHGHGSGFEAK